MVHYAHIWKCYSKTHYYIYLIHAYKIWIKESNEQDKVELDSTIQDTSHILDSSLCQKHISKMLKKRRWMKSHKTLYWNRRVLIMRLKFPFPSWLALVGSSVYPEPCIRSRQLPGVLSPYTVMATILDTMFTLYVLTSLPWPWKTHCSNYLHQQNNTGLEYSGLEPNTFTLLSSSMDQLMLWGL